MSSGFDAAFTEVKELVADFRANKTLSHSQACKEQDQHRDFTERFWPVLDWDVNQETQKNPFEQEISNVIRPPSQP
jgi:hypothetical protein